MFERGIRIPEEVIKRGNPDQFALQRVFKEFNAWYEYLVDGKWQRGNPSKKPDGKRVTFSLDSFRMARSTYFAWREFSEMSTYRPVRPEEIIKRMVDPWMFMQMSMVFGSTGVGYAFPSYRRIPSEGVYFFVPWGVRPEGEFGQPEREAMERIRGAQIALVKRNIRTKVLLMPADVYATEVNQQVAPEKATQYFDQVREVAEGKGFLVKPWSKIREENQDEYDTLAEQLTNDAIQQEIPAVQVEKTIQAARRRSGYASQRGVREAAFRYLRERMCEATIIEKAYTPIKVSAVSKNKDNFVDRNLPRLYLIPPELQFPWLK